jgi:hypothetical protein
MQKKKIYLTAESILKYLYGDEKLEGIIIFRNNEFNILTSDQSLYEALASIEKRKKFNLTKLIKLLEVSDIVSFKRTLNTDRKILTHERAKELRNKVKEMKKEKYQY